MNTTYAALAILIFVLGVVVREMMRGWPGPSWTDDEDK